MLPRLAPPPAGQPPPWIGINDAHPEPPGLAAPTVDDLARLAVRRLWERLSDGACPVSPRDAVALLRLAAESGPGAVPDARWEATVKRTLLQRLKVRGLCPLDHTRRACVIGVAIGSTPEL